MRFEPLVEPALFPALIVFLQALFGFSRLSRQCHAAFPRREIHGYAIGVITVAGGSLDWSNEVNHRFDCFPAVQAAFGGRYLRKFRMVQPVVLLVIVSVPQFAVVLEAAVRRSDPDA